MARVVKRKSHIHLKSKKRASAKKDEKPDVRNFARTRNRADSVRDHGEAS